MANYFRKRHQASGDLPTTMGGNSSSSGSSFLTSAFKTSNGDGSARSIHVQPPVVTKWKQSSRAVKITYSVALVSFMVIILGWRTLTYNSAHVYLECSTTDCNLVFNAVGRDPKIRLTVPRNQILGAKPAKVNKEGVIVNDNVDINSEWKYQTNNGGSGKKGNKKNSQNYKGPDKDGNYLTYIVTVQDIDLKQDAERKLKEQNGDQTQQMEESRAVDLAPIRPFLVKASTKSDEGKDNNNPPQEYRIVMRQNGINQTRRRVRNMVQKIDSYAKKRRHKLVVKESASPDWRGVLMLVLGGCSFLLSLLLALFWEDEESHSRQQSGPGARKRHPQQHQSSNNKNGTVPNVNPYQRATPSRYEVSTQSKKGTGVTTIRRRN